MPTPIARPIVMLEKQPIDFKKVSKINDKLNEYITNKTIIDMYYESVLRKHTGWSPIKSSIGMVSGT